MELKDFMTKVKELLNSPEELETWVTENQREIQEMIEVWKKKLTPEQQKVFYHHLGTAWILEEMNPSLFYKWVGAMTQRF